MLPSLLVVLATAAIVSATGTGCAKNSIEDLVTRTSCGCTKSITKCLRRVDIERLEEIEKCYIAGGCEASDAAVGAMWFAKECYEEVADGKDDLRRRADTTEAAAAATATTTEADSTTAKTTSKTTNDATTAKTTIKTTATPSSAAASTTADSTTTYSSTTASSSTTVSSTTSDSTTSSTTSASTTTATTAAITTGTLACSVTTTKSTSMCFVDSAGKTQSCIPTVTAIGSCAPGFLCFASSVATPATCMKKDNSLTTSGLIVTIAFAIGILATIIAVTILQIKNRSKQRRVAHQAALMAAGAGKGRAGSDVESANTFSQGRRAQGMQSEANLPLIGNEQQQYYNQPEYAAQGPPAPRIHQGLGALGQEPRY